MISIFHVELLLWAAVRNICRVSLPAWAGISVFAAGFVLSNGKPLSGSLMLAGLTIGLMTAIVGHVLTKLVWLKFGATYWKTRLQRQAHKRQSLAPK